MDISIVEQLVKLLQCSEVSKLKVSVGAMSVKVQRGSGLEIPSDHLAELESPVEPDALKGPKTTEIRAQMVGIFHLLGDIKPGMPVANKQPVGYIESMKLMNEVASDSTGLIGQLLVEDGSPVEFGQLLLTVVEED